MSLQTPEGLEQSVVNLAQILQKLVEENEKMRRELDELRARYEAHNHGSASTNPPN